MKNLYQQVEQLNSNLVQVIDLLQEILQAVTPPPAARIVFIVGGKKVTQMQIQDNGSLTVSIAAEDVKGNPVSLDPSAAPSWAVDNASLATIVPSADGLSAVVTPVGPLGSFNVQCSIPAVNAESALQGSLAVEVIASAATQIVLNGVAN
jgi:hypothetical protein